MAAYVREIEATLNLYFKSNQSLVVILFHFRLIHVMKSGYYLIYFGNSGNTITINRYESKKILKHLVNLQATT